ncbi:MAG: sulfatase-like hydrolase/transferase [Gloeobacteraceae cyanobacterium ES-bin-316]|nr:sulfatase-like hydrolase/transferase [Ferruginibacter sp.]
MIKYSFSRLNKILLCILACFVFYMAKSQRPNIIYIMTDDMGYADLSGYGGKSFSTPYLDKLASEGVKFVNAYAAGPLCTPTRAAFFTGRYPARTPVGLIEPLTNSRKDSSFGLTTAYPSVATLLKAAGYQTALIGKWHLGSLPQHSPIINGFDYFFGIHTGAADYISHRGHGVAHDLYENDEFVYPSGYLTDLFAQKATAFLKQSHKKPFFLALTFTAPHWPWQGPGDKAYADSLDFRKGGSPAIYAAMMKSLDDAIGQIMNALGEQNLAEKTLVIFTNDNGGEKFSDNGGLSNAKSTLWEGGIRVPAFVRWPGKILPAVTNQVAVTMDWTATILAAAKVKPQKGFALDGLNLLPVLMGSKKKIVERTLYWRTFQRSQQKAIRVGDWKYLQDPQGEYLFNLKEDFGEKVNLKEKEPARFLKLKKMYAEWEKQMLPPLAL